MRSRKLAYGRTLNSWLWVATTAVGVGTLPGVSRGVDRVFFNGGGVWSAAPNWTPLGVPQNGDNAKVVANCHFDYAYSAGGGLNSLSVSTGFYGDPFLQDTANSRMIANYETISDSLSSHSAPSYLQSTGLNSCNILVVGLGSTSATGGLYSLSGGSLSTTGPANEVTVGSFSGAAGTFLLSGTGTLLSSRLDVGLSGGNGTFIQSGGYANIQQGPEGYGLLIAGNAGSGGNVSISGGTLITDAAYLGGYFLTGGTGILNVSGGRMTVDGRLLIYNTIGTQINLSGGIFEVAELNTQGTPVSSLLNWTGGAFGSLTPLTISSSGMLGSNISVTGNRRLFVGRLSDANTYPGSVFIGGASTGVATLSSGGALSTDGHLIVGIEGAGRFIQTGGTSSVGYDLLVGYGGNGYYSLSGGAVIVNGPEARLGSNGNGTIDMASGTLLSPALNVGYSGNGSFTQAGGYVNLSGDEGLRLGINVGDTAIVTLSGGSLTTTNAYVGGVSGRVGGTGILTVQGGNVTVNGDLRVWPTGTVLFNGGSFTAGVPDLRGGGKVLLSPGHNKAIRLRGTPTGIVSIDSANGSKLDLADNAMIGDYDPASGVSPLFTIKQLLVIGRNGGAWTGNGITSSSAAAAASSAHKTSLGYAEASDLGVSTFFGQSVDSSTVLVRYTLNGDSNLDGKVDLTDFTFLAANFNGTGKNWLQGDYSYDGNIDLSDFTFLASNFNAALPAPSDGLGASVPEPLMTGSLALIPTLLQTRRRRT